MLNRWRYVDYTGDGCSLFECLVCDAQWISQTRPGYTQLVEGQPEYVPVWHFCPHCGTQWAGSQREGDTYGPRRTRIYDAIRAYEAERGIPITVRRYVWIVQEQYWIHWYDCIEKDRAIHEVEWDTLWISLSPMKAKDALTEYRKWQLGQQRKRKGSIHKPDHTPEVLFRFRLVLDRRYLSSDHPQRQIVCCTSPVYEGTDD